MRRIIISNPSKRPEINQNSKEFISFRSQPEKYQGIIDFIDYETLLFNYKSKEKDEMIKQILDLIDKNKEKDYFIYYVVDCLIYYIFIRPKYVDIPCYVLSTLSLNIPNIPHIINQIKQSHKKYKENKYLEFLLYNYGLSNKKPLMYERKKESVLSIYKKDSIQYILQEDDVEKLKLYLANNSETLKKHQRITGETKLTGLIRKFSTNSNILMTEFCCFYDSLNCFKLLKANGFIDGNVSRPTSIAGGNLEIIHILEQEGVDFDGCFGISIEYHHKDISQWLLSNYHCERLFLTQTLKYLDYQAFIYLLNIGVTEDPIRFSPLIHLCKQCYINSDAVKLLLEKNPVVKVSKNGKTPLFYVCKQEKINLELMELLISHGAEVDGVTNSLSLLSHLCRHENVNTDAIKLLLDHRAYIISESNGNTPLSYLCKNKNINIDAIKLLIEHGAEINPKIYKIKNNVDPPLSCLCKNYNVNLEAIKLLLDHGANPNAGTVKPLFYLCKKKNINCEAIQILLEYGANVDLPLNDVTPLFYLCSQPIVNLDAIKLLVEYGADVNKLSQQYDSDKHKIDYTPIFPLLTKSPVDYAAVNYLLEKGADVNQGNTTPFIFICQQEYVSLSRLEYLLKIGADINAIRNGRTSLSYMCMINKINLNNIKFLLDNGADPNLGSTTPICSLIPHSQNIDALMLLINAGANVNQESKFYDRNNCYYTYKPLYSVCKQDPVNIDIMKILLKHGANANDGEIKYKNNYESHISPLSILCKKRNVNIQAIEILLEYGADVNQECEGFTPLCMLCSINSSTEAIKLLLDNGADVNKPSNGKTPLEYLSQHKPPNTFSINLLMERGAHPI